MWYKLFKDDGNLEKIYKKYPRYKDSKEEIYILKECFRIKDSKGRENAALGYTEFESREECLKAWELTEVKEEETK